MGKVLTAGQDGIAPQRPFLGDLRRYFRIGGKMYIFAFRTPVRAVSNILFAQPLTLHNVGGFIRF